MFNKEYFSNNYKKNYKVYRYSAQITDVMPHFLAALHYRENSFRSFNIINPLQFDPVLTTNTMTKLLQNYTNLDNDMIKQFVKKGQNNFVVASVLCGCFLQNKLKHDNKPPLMKDMNSKDDQDLIMRSFELYNGTAYGSQWKSTYVVNMLDDDHQNMRIRGSYIDRRGTRQRVNVIDRRPGAYTVFKYLDEAFTHNW